MVRVAVTPPAVVRAVAEKRTAAGICKPHARNYSPQRLKRRVSLLDSFSFPCNTTYCTVIFVGFMCVYLHFGELLLVYASVTIEL